MGKQRRMRGKYHNAAVKSDIEMTEVESGLTYDTKTLADAPQNVVNDFDDKSVAKIEKKSNKGEIFDGLHIAVSKLNTCLTDDTKSVHSLAKTFKSLKRSLGGRSLKKDDKKKLRHDMFLSKIDVFYKNRLEQKKNKRQAQGEVSIKDLDEALPSVDMVFHKTDKKVKQPRPVATKPKGIEKAKKRQKNMAQNCEAFKKVVEEMKSSEKNLDVVTDYLRQNLISSVTN